MRKTLIHHETVNGLHKIVLYFCKLTSNDRRHIEDGESVNKPNILPEDNAKTSVPHQRKVWCYPIQFALPCPRLPIVEFHQDKEITSLRYKGEVMKLNNLYFNKLVRTIPT